MKDKADLNKKNKALVEENRFLKQIIARMPGNVYWKNKNGFYIGCNKNAANLVGLKNESEIFGKTIYDLAGSPIAETIDKTDKKIMRSKKEEVLEEVGFDMNRNPATYLSIKAPLFNENREVSGLLCVSMDITKIKEAEASMREAKDKAEKMTRMKSEFVNIVEHDIRAPFSGIHAISSLLAQSETDPDKKEALESIVNSSKASLEYATRLLSFTKIEEEFNQVSCRFFSISALIQSIIEIQAPLAQAKNLKLKVDISSTVPDCVSSDPERLKGILVNLVANGIKFTDVGSVSIKVHVLKKTKKNCLIKFSVRDTGIGIPEHKQRFIHDKFFQVNPDFHGICPGFGLGLPVIKKFVTELEGKIKLESTVGKGSVFSVIVPLKLSS